MGRYGTNLEGFGAFEGGVNADKGAPLVSTNSDGETALLFGPAAMREVVAGIANGDFAIPPDSAGDTITDSNPLPYWTFTDTSSSGAITAAIVGDTASGSGNALRFSIANNTTTGKAAQVSRYFPVVTSRSRALWQGIELNLSNITSTANARITAQLDWYGSDQTTQVSTAILTTPTLAARTGTTATITTAAAHYVRTGDTVTVALTSGPTGYIDLNGTYVVTSVTTTAPHTIVYTTSTSGTVTSGAAAGTITEVVKSTTVFNAITSTYPDNSIQVPDYTLGGSLSRAGTPPATAAYGRVTIIVETIGTVTPAASIDVNEVRGIRATQELIINDSYDPTNYAPAYINNSYGIMTVSTGLDASGQQPQILLQNNAGITLNAGTSSAGNIKLQGQNSNWASRASVASVTQSFTNNTTTKVALDTASSTAANTTYDPNTWFSNANDRITVSQAGFYCISGSIAWAANTTGRRLCSIYLNGNEIATNGTNGLATGTTTQTVSVVLYLAANDYLELWGTQTSGGALSTVVVAGYFPALALARVGA